MRPPTNRQPNRSAKRDSKPASAAATGSGMTVSSIAMPQADVSAARKRPTANHAGRQITNIRRRRRANLIKTTQLILLAALLCGSAYFLLTNRRFSIKQIHVDGIQTINVQHLATVATVPVHSNIFVYLMSERSSFCRRIIDSDPAILSASVAIQFPNSLMLHIQERQPCSNLRLSDGTSYLMDSSRVAYREVTSAPPNLTVVKAAGSSMQVSLGKPLPQDIDNEVAAAYSVMLQLNALPSSAMAAYRELAVDQYDNSNVVLQNGLIVKLGQLDGLSDRLSAANTALAEDPALPQKAIYLDFTSDRPAIKPKQPSVTTISGAGSPQTMAVATPGTGQ